MKIASVSQIKRGNYDRFAKLPREGSRLREAYDFFVSSRGIPVAVLLSTYPRTTIDNLRDYYGLDIRCIESGKWVLAGEWFGKHYVDYIAAVMASEAK